MPLCNRLHPVSLTGFLLLAFLMSEASAEGSSCSSWAARVVAVQGVVESRPGAAEIWRSVQQGDSLCPGDQLTVRPKGRATLQLPNSTLLRLDQNSTLSFPPQIEERTSLLDLVKGAIYCITRTPRPFKVRTPFVNAGVEGTEFLVRADAAETFVGLVEGVVSLENTEGKLNLAAGECAVTSLQKAPVRQLTVKPRDAAHWTLHYPVTPDSPADAWQKRTADLLAVGRLDEARAELAAVTSDLPGWGSACAFRSLIAVAFNDTDGALDLARQAVAANPGRSFPLLALSYALQARFDLRGAEQALQQAVALESANPLLLARLAELQLALGKRQEALLHVTEAARRAPDHGYPLSILGFVQLTGHDTAAAEATFTRAVQSDPSLPLPRLGLGLARIRQGYLTEGREDLEIAVALDPGNALLRSTLGKAYHDEGREGVAARQISIAQELDPNDPTPLLYASLQAQSASEPVRALGSLEHSIELNDNRAVYRSRLLLDEDIAVREADRARIHAELGFSQLALRDGYRSLSDDPASHAAHRFLAEAYGGLPRHEIARVSEQLQAQLLQPHAATPSSPILAESRLGILQGTAFSPGLNEYSSLFTRNGLSLLAGGVVGGEKTAGGHLIQTGLWDHFSYALSHFYYATDGFRDNAELRHNLSTVILQYNPSPQSQFQGEYRISRRSQGDIEVRFNPEEFSPSLSQERDVRLYRIAGRHDFTPGSTLLGLVSYSHAMYGLQDDIPGIVNLDTSADERGFGSELQLLHRTEPVTFIGGVGYFNSHLSEGRTTTLPPSPETPGFPVTFSEEFDGDLGHTNAYLYSRIHLPRATMILGASGDFLRGSGDSRSQLNPKIGLTVRPSSAVTVRLAAFRTLKRTLLNDQTLEPTEVAGFNQHYDDAEGTDAWRYGAGIDLQPHATLRSGAEYSLRKLDTPIILDLNQAAESFSWREEQVRCYLAWTPAPWLALGADYLYEQFRRKAGSSRVTEVDTDHLPLSAAFFPGCRLSFKMTATWIRQHGLAEDPLFPPDNGFAQTPWSDAFWLFDASVGYRFRQLRGMIALEGKNLFAEEFRYQDMDPANPRYQPGRRVLLRLTLAF